MIRRPPSSTRTATLFPYTTLFRSLVVGHPARLAADAERFPDDQLGAALGVFTHDADVIAVGDLLREAVVDLAALLRCGQSAMQRADPLLLDRHCVDAGHLQLLLRQRSEERRVGKECVRTVRFRWSP